MKNTLLHHFFNMLIIEQDYFECHEIMEDAWKNKSFYSKQDKEVFLILVATAEYHYRRGNKTGAYRSLQKALNIYQKTPFNLNDLGLKQNFLELINNRLTLIHVEPFTPMNYPITDEVFEALFHESNFDDKESFKSYLASHKVIDENLIHRHKLRDRTEVINERLRALNRKKRD